jgi:hypothetical protein
VTERPDAYNSAAIEVRETHGEQPVTNGSRSQPDPSAIFSKSSSAAALPPARESLVRVALVHFVAHFAAVTIGLALFLVALVAVLRRYGQVPQLATPSKIVQTPPGLQADAELVTFSDLGRILESVPQSSLDLGPTFAEELRLKEEAAAQQERAMLQMIFEQNMQLREELGSQRSATVANSVE